MFTYGEKLRHLIGQKHNTPHSQYWSDLEQCIHQLSESYDYVIIGMDSNGNLDNTTSAPCNFVAATCLHDITPIMQPELMNQPTCSRGKNRLDTIIKKCNERINSFEAKDRDRELASQN